MSQPVLPIDLMFYGPGEYWTYNLFDLNKKTYITITDQLSSLILADQLKNKSKEENVQVLTDCAYKMRVPHTIQTYCGTNYTNSVLKKFCEKLNNQSI